MQPNFIINQEKPKSQEDEIISYVKNLEFGKLQKLVLL